jgi:hypothetical protein
MRSSSCFPKYISRSPLNSDRPADLELVLGDFGILGRPALIRASEIGPPECY